MIYIFGRRDDLFCQQSSKNQFSQMLGQANKFHSQMIIYIDIHHMFVQYFFLFRTGFSISSDILICFCL